MVGGRVRVRVRVRVIVKVRVGVRVRLSACGLSGSRTTVSGWS